MFRLRLLPGGPGWRLGAARPSHRPPARSVPVEPGAAFVTGRTGLASRGHHSYITSTKDLPTLLLHTVRTSLFTDISTEPHEGKNNCVQDELPTPIGRLLALTWTNVKSPESRRQLESTQVMLVKVLLSTAVVLAAILGDTTVNGQQATCPTGATCSNGTWIGPFSQDNHTVGDGGDEELLEPLVKAGLVCANPTALKYEPKTKNESLLIPKKIFLEIKSVPFGSLGGIISVDEFLRILQWLLEFIQCFDGIDVQLGIITYECLPKLDVRMGEFSVGDPALKDAIEGLERRGGNSRTGQALHYVKCMSDIPEDVWSVVILVSDGSGDNGQGTNDYIANAAMLRDSGFALYAVAAGNPALVNTAALATITGYPDRVVDQTDPCRLADQIWNRPPTNVKWAIPSNAIATTEHPVRNSVPQTSANVQFSNDTLHFWKGTTSVTWWDSNPGPLGSEPKTLPLRHTILMEPPKICLKTDKYNNMLFDCIEKNLKTWFGFFGCFVSRHEVFFLVGPLCLSGLLGAGLSHVRTDSHIDALFSPYNAPARKERAALGELFPVKEPWEYRNPVQHDGNYVRVVLTSPGEGNILTERYLQWVRWVDTLVTSEVVTFGGANFTYADVCAFQDSECVGEDFRRLLHVLDISQGSLSYPVTLLEDGRRLFVAGAVQLIYYLRTNDSLHDHVSRLWEDQVEKKLLGLNPPDLRLAVSTSRTLEREYLENSAGISARFAGTVLLAVFCTGALCFTADCVRSKPLLGVCGVVTACFSGLASAGLISLCGGAFTTTLVPLPVLLLGYHQDSVSLCGGAFTTTLVPLPVLLLAPVRVGGTSQRVFLRALIYIHIEYNTGYSVSPEVSARPRVGSPDGRRPEGDPTRGRAGTEGDAEYTVLYFIYVIPTQENTPFNAR
ncbi:Patched domain-containing protein 1 [Branchiostoma belcheri]|nr:Patched domain-containing protein 1 [Branchiostoma belcheri]